MADHHQEQQQQGNDFDMNYFSKQTKTNKQIKTNKQTKQTNK